MTQVTKPRGFDYDEVVRAARDLFWERGYFVDDEQEALGRGGGVVTGEVFDAVHGDPLLADRI